MARPLAPARRADRLCDRARSPLAARAIPGDAPVALAARNRPSHCYTMAGLIVGPEGRPVLVMWPLGGIGGTANLTMALMQGIPFVLIEKFTVEALIDTVKRNRLPSLALTPTMVRMIYDANVPAEDLASVEVFWGGSGPLDPALAEAMEPRYGKPVLWAMGATEFCGSIMGWTLPGWLPMLPEWPGRALGG